MQVRRLLKPSQLRYIDTSHAHVRFKIGCSSDVFLGNKSQRKVYGKRGVHKDTKLQDGGGQILEEDGILYNCTFVASDRARGVNEYISDFHLKRCEDALLEFMEKLKQQKEKGMKGEAMWSDFSQRMFTLMPSMRPFILRDPNDLADHVSVPETLEIFQNSISKY